MEKLKKSLEREEESKILIDTSVLIEYYKKRRLEELGENAISIITAIEFIRGISEEKQEKVLNIFKEMFEIIEIDLSMVIPFSKIYRDLKRRGELIDDADLYIGCTAIITGYPLYTHNKKHFKRLERYGLKLYEL